MRVGALPEPTAVRTFSLYASLAKYSALTCCLGLALFHCSKEERKADSEAPVRAQTEKPPAGAEPPPGWLPPPQAARMRAVAAETAVRTTVRRVSFIALPILSETFRYCFDVSAR